MSNNLALRNKAFSPDIHGLQIAWDSTSLGLLKECPRKYQYMMVEGWAPRETSVHLWFGSLYHKALEGYDHARSQGHPHDFAQRYALFICLTQTWDYKKKRAISFDSPNKSRETLVRSVLWYLEQFGENDSCQTVQLANGKPAVELSFRIPLGHLAPTGEPYVLCGHLDRLVTFQDHYYVLDRKTSGHQIDDRFFQSFTPSNQMQIYHLGGQLVLQTPTRGIIIDGAQIAVSFTRFKRGQVTYTPAQNEEFYQELGVWFGLAASFAEASFWPKNEKSCITGDTILRVTRGKAAGIKFTADKVYQMFHGTIKGNAFKRELATYLLCDKDGQAGNQRVVDAIKQGVKPVYLLTTTDTKIKATADHRFNTPTGWQRLDELQVGDSMFYWTAKAEKQKRNPVWHTRAEVHGIRHYPFGYISRVKGYTYKTQRKSRLVLEAAMNGFTLGEFIHILKTDREKAITLKYLPPDMEVHHKDRNPSNDSLENLEAVLMLKHKAEHKDEIVKNLNSFVLTEIVSIEYAGEEMTYDFVMEAPHHNFIANDLIAHNCGNYGGCAFQSICSKPPSIREDWLKAAFFQRVWDPLTTRGDI